MTSDATGLIGLAQRAGRCVSGAELCEKALRGGKAKLLLLDAETSENTASKMRAACDAAGVPLKYVPSLGRAIGKESRMTCAITDQGLADAIEKKLTDTAINPGV